MALHYKDGRIEFAGAVLAVEFNHYRGFEWYEHRALVWTGEKAEYVVFGTAHEGGMSHVETEKAEADATAEIRAAYEGYERRRAEEANERRAECEARIPYRGKVVRVVKGRKVAIGIKGEVVWFGKGHYGKQRVGLKDVSGKVHWTDASNVEVVS